MSRLPPEVRRGLLLACVALGLGWTGRSVGHTASLELRFLYAVSDYAPSASFLSPQGLAFDAARSEIYIADTGNNQVVVLSKTGVPVYRFRHWVKDPAGQRIAGEPQGLAARGDGMLLVSDGLSDQVDVVDLRGQPVQTIDVTALLARDIRASPGKMAVGGQGNVFLVERSSGQVLEFDPKQKLVRSFGGRGKGQGRFEMIADVAVGANGSVYVLDSIGTPVVQAFDDEGRWVLGFGRHSNKPEDFHFPIALTIDADGRIWIADAFSHEVKAYSTSGQFLGAYGEMGAAPGQFYFPSAVVAAPDGILYVLEKAGRRLQAFQIVGPAVPERR